MELTPSSNSKVFHPATSSIELDIQVKDADLPEWGPAPVFELLFAHHMSETKKNVLAKLLYYRNQNDDPTFQIDFNSTVLQSLPYQARYKRNLSLAIPAANLLWDAEIALDFSLENEILLWQSNVTHTSTGQKAVYYLLNTTYSRESGQVYLSDDLSSAIYQRQLRLVARFPELLTNFNADLNITAHSQIEPLLNVDLWQRFDDGKETMKMTHPLVDIDVSANWQRGYKKTFNFKSKNKNFIPNMEWEIDYPDNDNGTTLRLRLLDDFQDFYLFCRKQLNSTQLVFTVCLHQKCSSEETYSDNFVAEIELSLLENPQQLTRTVIYNPKVISLIKKMLDQKTEQMVSGVFQLLSDPARATSPFLQMGKYVKTSAATIRNEMRNFFYYFGYVLTKDKHIIMPSLSIVLHTREYLYLVFPQLKETYVGWFWNYFEIPTKIIPWASQIGAKAWEEYWFRQGPVIGKSYVSTMSLPVYWTNFNNYPKQWSSAFRRKATEIQNAITKHIPTARQQFHDGKYTRHALITENGDVYTFDGRAFHLQQHFKTQCAQLLSHDFENQMFSIYKQGPGIHILFPDMNFHINMCDGKITINGSVKDLPFDSNGEIRIVRKENIIELTTEYHLKVIFHLRDGTSIFYTNEYKFNQLTGIFGNNNDNPMDDGKDLSQYELTGETSCRTREKPLDQFKCNSSDENLDLCFEWWNVLWHPSSPCHAIVSPKEFVAYAHSQCRDVPPKLLNAYLALCGAKAVPVDSIEAYRCDRRYATLEKIDGELEVVFLMDQTYRLSGNNFMKGVETLVHAIQKKFIEDDYNKITFGLVGFRGRGYRYEPHQHTMNGKLLGSAHEFIVNGFKTLQFNGPKDGNASAAIHAIKYAAEHYSLSRKAVHVFVIVTPEDQGIIEVSQVHAALQKLNQQSGIVYAFSSYASAAKSKGIYGIRGDGYVFPQPKTEELFVDFPKGQLAKLSSATRGAIWQLSYLEDSDIPPKRYVQSIATEMADRARQDAGKCRQRHCSVYAAEQDMTACELKNCENIKS